MKIAFLGIGKVGFALANNLSLLGYEIIIAHNDSNSESVKSAVDRNSNFHVQPVQNAINSADMVFLALPFGLCKEVLKHLEFQNKIVVDCTNPVGPEISHGLKSKISGAEKIQEWAKDARIVKSYTIYGFENLVNPKFPGYDTRPVMLIAGDEKDAKSEIRKLNDALGFDTLDTGNLTQSLHLEHMTLLWVKMVRVNGHHPNFTWSYLER